MFWAEIWKISVFFICKFSVFGGEIFYILYLNRHVFVMLCVHGEIIKVLYGYPSVAHRWGIYNERESIFLQGIWNVKHITEKRYSFWTYFRISFFFHLSVNTKDKATFCCGSLQYRFVLHLPMLKQLSCNMQKQSCILGYVGFPWQKKSNH